MSHKLGLFNSSFLLFKGAIIPKHALTQWFHFQNFKGLRDRHTQKLNENLKLPAYVCLQGITSVTFSFTDAMSQIIDYSAPTPKTPRSTSQSPRDLAKDCDGKQDAVVPVLFVMAMQNYRGYAGFRLNKSECSAHPFEKVVILREGIQMFVANVEQIEISSKGPYRKLYDMQKKGQGSYEFIKFTK